jgi:hypothetical protein
VPVEVANQVPWRISNVLGLPGAAAGQEWNGMTASWVTQVAAEPVLGGGGGGPDLVYPRPHRRGRCVSVNLGLRGDTPAFVSFCKPAWRDGA